MLQAFEEWVESRRPILEREDTSVSFTKPPLSTGWYADFDLPGIMARATVWQNGLCDVEAWDCASEQALFFQHYEAEDTEHLHSALDEFLERLRSLKGR